jgi:putative ABC transport system permease protein
MTPRVDLKHILHSLRRHQLIVLILVIEVAFSFSVVCNMALMASHRIDAWHQESGLQESGLGMLSSTDRSGGIGANHWAHTVEAMRAIEAVSGVEDVAAAQSLPLNGVSYNISFSRSSPADPDSGDGVQVSVFTGSPNLVDVLGLQISKGRPFTREEYVLNKDQGVALAEVGAVLVSEQLARKLFGSHNALGQMVYVERHPMRIVGIVRHLLSPTPTLGGENQLTAIVPVLPNSDTTTFLIRARPTALNRTLLRSAQALFAANPLGVIGSAFSYKELRTKYFQHDVAMLRLMIYAMIALLVVTIIGIAGLVSFWVARRGNSIGVRRALGALRSDNILHFLVENICVVAAGVCVGVAGAYTLNAYLIRHYGESPMSLIFLLFGIVLMVVAGQLASLGPALRAAKISPSAAMRGM